VYFNASQDSVWIADGIPQNKIHTPPRDMFETISLLNSAFDKAEVARVMLTLASGRLRERPFFEEHIKAVARVCKMEEVVFLRSSHAQGDYTQTKMLKDFSRRQIRFGR